MPETPKQVELPPHGIEQDLGLEIHPAVQCSQAAFRRDLPELLQNRQYYRQWVAYHGDERIGIARTVNELLDRCARRGLQEHEYVVRCIVPEIPPHIDSTPLHDA